MFTKFELSKPWRRNVSEDIDMNTIILMHIMQLGCLGKLSRYKCLPIRIRVHASTIMTSGLPPNGGNIWLTKRRSASEELSSMETMICVPRNACQGKVCKTAFCILFTGYCLTQLRICRLAESSRCVRRYCSPCYINHFLLEVVYSTSGKRRGSLLGHQTYSLLENTRSDLLQNTS